MTFWSVVLLVVGAVVGLVIWRIQLIGKRRFEFAEEALIAFCMAKGAVNHVRSMGGYSGEGQTREGTENETEEQRRYRDQWSVPIERFESHSKLFSTLRKIQLLSRYHLGQDAYDAFEALFAARTKVIGAARSLRQFEQWPDKHREHQSVIWSGGDDDEISNSLQCALENWRTLVGRT